MEWQKILDAEFTPLLSKAQSKGPEGRVFQESWKIPKTILADVAVLTTFPPTKCWRYFGTWEANQGCSRMQWHKLLLASKRDKLGVGGSKASLCFYLEVINEQELS